VRQVRRRLLKRKSPDTAAWILDQHRSEIKKPSSKMAGEAGDPTNEAPAIRNNKSPDKRTSFQILIQ